MKRPLWLELLAMVLIPIVGMALGVGAMLLLNLGQADYGALVVNLSFLAAAIGLWRVFRFSPEELALQVFQGQIGRHLFLSLGICLLYLIFYIFAIRIAGLKPFSASTAWGLLTYFVVVVAEELYFRGILYGFLQKRFSAKTALVVTSLLFGLFHAQQGLRGMVSRTFSGWLWGSVRYSSGMIFLLIFPVHFAYNAVWLLFEGNWNNPPLWAVYALPAVEFLIGLAIVLLGNPSPTSNQRAV
ncbi:MAG: CPBP family intramembrane metalloprotease [Caldilineaceae bacterium]|nr:CPBP family intramembrane metalloprotease [Caldilineaceae bacterium]